MTTLLELRERLLSIYAQYENYIRMAGRFLTVLLAMQVIDSQIGQQGKLSGILPALIVALLAAVCPPNLMVVILGAVILLDLYSIALEAAAVGGVLFLVLLLVYLRFTPGDTILLLLYPACRTIGLQYALPIAGGLLFTPASGITVAVGTIADSFIRFVHQNEATIGGSGGTSSTDSMMTSLQFLMDGIMQDKAMMITAAAMVVAAAVVYALRRLPMPYAWIAASGVGALLQLVMVLAGALTQDVQISAPLTFVGTLGGFAVGAVLSFLVFNLDYSRTESTQFEDDEYYYYVKAIPKNAFASPRRTVRTVNARKGTGEYAAAHGRRPEERRENGYREERVSAWEEPAYGNPEYAEERRDEYEDEFREDF